jgi:hypothetical protein
MTKAETNIHWTTEAEKVLVGKTIKAVRYMTDDERDFFGWYKKPIIFILNDNTLVYPSMDDEGNDGGSLFFINDKSNGVMPTL